MHSLDSWILLMPWVRKSLECIFSSSACLEYLENLFLVFTVLTSELKLIPALHSEWIAKPWSMMVLSYS